MKKIFNKITALAMAAAAAFLPSCTDNIENSETPVFPEKVKLDVTPGGSVTVSFTANMDWSASLQSDEDAARYFAIEDGAFDVQTVKGKAGEVNITVKCIVDKADLVEHKAELALTMGEQTQVIADIILGTLNQDYSVKYADVSEDGKSFISSAADGEPFAPQFTGEGLADNAEIKLLWSDDEKAYKAYLQITANFTVNFGGSAVESQQVDIARTGNVCTIETGTQNFGEDIRLEFIIKSPDEVVSHPYTLVIPTFEPHFSIYPVTVDEYGEFEWADETFAEAGFIYTYDTDSPLAESTVTDLEWPAGNDGYGFHLLINANFEYEVQSKPDWMGWAKKGTSGSMTEYDIDVNVKDYSLEDQSGKIVFVMKGKEEYSYEFTFNLPGCSDILRSTFGETVLFNAEGYFRNTNGEYQQGPAFADIISTEGLVFHFFNRSTDGTLTHEDHSPVTDTGGSVTGMQTSWITFNYAWTGDDIIQRLRAEISVETKNFTEPREAVIVALPKAVAQTVPDAGSILTADGKEIAEAYSGYILTTVRQGEFKEEGLTLTVEGDDKAAEILGYAEFSELTTQEEIMAATEDEKIREAAATILGMEGHLYLLTYINGYLSEGGTFGLTVNGDFAIVRDTAGGTLYPAPADPGYDWLSISYDTFGSKLYVNMGIPPGGAGEMGDTGMIVFNDGQQDITGLICVRGYSNENPFPQQ